METVITAVLASILTAVFTFAVQYYLKESSRIRSLRTDRLTKLLLPLYIKINDEEVEMSANMVHDDGDPAGFLDDLPKFYSDVIPTLSENLYLADDELTEKAIKFIGWAKVSQYDSSRFDQIMTNGTNDVILYEFRKCVLKKYKEEKEFLFRKRPFWSEFSSQ